MVGVKGLGVHDGQGMGWWGQSGEVKGVVR